MIALKNHGQALAVLLTFSGASALAIDDPATFQGIGTLPGYTDSFAAGVSADGTAIAATARGPKPDLGQAFEAFIWTQGNVSGLGRGPGQTGPVAKAISGDGRVVLGRRWGSAGLRAFVSTSGQLEQYPWGDPCSDNSAPPGGCSSDGTIIWDRCGRQYIAGQILEPPATMSSVQDVSGDGATALATLFLNNGGNDNLLVLILPDRSVLLTQIALEPNPPHTGILTRDGSTVVAGWSKWRRGDALITHVPFTPLISGSDWNQWNPRDISDDGAVVVGGLVEPVLEPHGPPSGPALVWFGNNGVRRLSCVLRQFGADTNGWTLVSAQGCSADGRTITGTGINPAGHYEAWIARIPHLPASPDFDQSGSLTIADIFRFLAAWFANDALGDFNGQGGRTVGDIFDFLAFWFNGCI